MSFTLILDKYISIPWLSCLDCILKQYRPRFNPIKLHKGFVVGRVTLGEAELQALNDFLVVLFRTLCTKIIPRFLKCKKLSVPLKDESVF